jgi:hypothetical protein
MRDSSFLNGELLFFQKGNKFRRQSFISRRIHNLKIVFLDPTIGTAELFPKAIILNAKSLDRNCSSIMLRRGTITRVLVGLEKPFEYLQPTGNSFQIP